MTGDRGGKGVFGQGMAHGPSRSGVPNFFRDPAIGPGLATGNFCAFNPDFAEEGGIFFDLIFNRGREIHRSLQGFEDRGTLTAHGELVEP